MVNLTKRSHDDLLKVSEATGPEKTNGINRALQVYARIEELQDKGLFLAATARALAGRSRNYWAYALELFTPGQRAEPAGVSGGRGSRSPTG